MSRIGVFPKSEEVLVCRAALGFITCGCIGACQAELIKGQRHVKPELGSQSEGPLEQLDGFGRLAIFQDGGLISCAGGPHKLGKSEEMKVSFGGQMCFPADSGT